MNDLIESLLNDVSQYAGVNPRNVKREKIESLLKTMNVDCIAGFGAFFKYEKPFLKFARIYRDIYIFNMPESQAFKINS